MNKETQLKDDIMRRITDEQITPKGKVYFVLRNTLIWILALVSVLVGALVMSAVYFSAFNADPFMYTKLGYGRVEYLLSALPLVWLGALTLFGLLAVFEVKHTKRGYRYPIWQLVTGMVILSMVLGYGFYIAGVAHVIDHKAARYLPHYQSVENRMEEMWSHPDKGFLSGIILGTTSDDAFMLRDTRGETWKLDKEILPEQEEAQLIVGNAVRIVGEQVGTSTFKPCAVGPWAVRGEREEIREEQALRMQRDVGGMQPAPPRIEERPGSGPVADKMGQGGALEQNRNMPSKDIIPQSERNNFRLRIIECEGDAHFPNKPGN